MGSFYLSKFQNQNGVSEQEYEAILVKPTAATSNCQVPALTLFSRIKSSSWSVHRNPFTSRGSGRLSSSARRPHQNWRPLALRAWCKSRPRYLLLVARSQERSPARGEATTETSSCLVTTTPSVSTTAVYLSMRRLLLCFDDLAFAHSALSLPQSSP